MHYIKDLRGNPKTRVSTDRTETNPGWGHVFENIFGSGWGYGFRSGQGQGIFYRSIIYFFNNFENKVELNGNHALHSQAHVSTANIGH